MPVPDVLRQGDYRVLVVDDDSPDGTGAVADALAREHPGRVDVLHRRGRRGLGRYYVDGFRRVLASDADLSLNGLAESLAMPWRLRFRPRLR